MNWSELLQAALTLVVGYALRYLLALIGFDVAPDIFNALVAAIVSALLGLFLLRGVRHLVRKTRVARFISE